MNDLMMLIPGTKIYFKKFPGDNFFYKDGEVRE
jgi:hypothetical protein